MAYIQISVDENTIAHELLLCRRTETSFTLGGFTLKNQCATMDVINLFSHKLLPGASTPISSFRLYTPFY